MKIGISTKRFLGVCITALLTCAAPTLGRAQYGDVTERIERIGKPHQQLYPDYIPERIYARNIWDMQTFGGRLYLGAGNSANSGPARNAGPLPIISYDPGSNAFRAEFTVDDEQIDQFIVLDGCLHVPGHDPTQNWKLGNYYRLETNGWHKYRNIPDGIHNYGMALHHGKLFAALGTREGAAVAASDDNGQSWTNHHVPGWRVYAFLRCQDTLFAASMFATWSHEQLARMPEENRRKLLDQYSAAVFQWQSGTFLPRPDLDPSVLFPGVSDDNEDRPTFFGKIAKSVTFGDVAIYIGARISNDHQFLPIGIFAAHSLEPDNLRVRRLVPSETAGDPWDLLVHDGALYVLTARRLPCGHYQVGVFQTRDLENWTPVLHFESPAFARSFERLEGSFYFGLGCKLEQPRNYRACELHEDTGVILRFAPHRSNESLLLGDLGLTTAFVQHLLPLLHQTEPPVRQAVNTLLRVFWTHHDPLRPRDRQAFLAQMLNLFRDHEDATDPERRLAFQILLLHARDRGTKATNLLLRKGEEDPSPQVRDLATLIQVVGLQNHSGRTLIRRLDGRSSVKLQNAAFAEFVNRPSPAFPGGSNAARFEQTDTIPLPREGWRFRRDPNVAFGYMHRWFAPKLDTSEWTDIQTGDFWASFLDEMYIGVGWYRITIDVPDLPDFDALGLHFGGVDENAWVWINGRYAGQHNVGPEGWDDPFQLDVTHLVQPGAPNQITVRAMNTMRNGGIWQPVELRVYERRRRENPSG